MTDRLPARCVLVTADRALTATVTELVGRMSGADLVASISAARLLANPPGCDVLIVADDRDRLTGAGDLAAACPGAGIVLLAREAGIDTYRAALAFGVRAVVELPLVPAQLVEAIGEAARSATGASAGAPAPLVSVAAATGGAGATSVALTLARVGGGVLVDLGGGWSRLPVPDAPGSTILDLARVGSAVGPALDALVQCLPGGLAVLPGPAQRDVAELLPAGLGTSLAREMRGRSTLTVADVGTIGCETARELAVAATHLVVVCSPDLRSCSAARGLLTAASAWGVGGDAVRLIVNRRRRSAELSARGVERVAGCPVVAVVDDRPRRMREYESGAVDLDRWPAGTPMAALRPLVRDLIR
jgi:MinD-like ATPase involved in chromosome partitioning or flagellar assembly